MLSDEHDQMQKKKPSVYVFSIIILFDYHVFWKKGNIFQHGTYIRGVRETWQRS